MYHCLRVPELLLNIFSRLYEDEAEREADFVIRRKENKTLFALARTCSHFKEPALDLLWHSMWSLAPLFRLLPDEVVDIRHVDTASLTKKSSNTEPIMFIKGILKNEHFTLWKSYAARVRMLDLARPYRRYVYNHDFRIDGSVYDILLSSSHTATPLLPNLRDVTMLVSDTNSLLRLCFNPSIRRVAMEGGLTLISSFTDTRTWDDLVAVLKEHNAPANVSEMSIQLSYSEHLTTPMPSAVLTHLLEYSHLSKLDLSSFELRDVSTLGQIGRFPLEMAGLNLTLLPYISLPEGCFANLKQTSIIVNDPYALMDLVHQWDAMHLEEFKVRRFLRSFFWDFNEIFQCLQQHLPTRTLRCISLYSIAPGQGTSYHDNTSNLSCDDLQHLFAFRNLVTVTLSAGGRFTLSDPDLMKIAATWPLLETFIAYEREVSIRPRITPAGLLSFIGALPRLSDLALRFDATAKFPALESVVSHRKLVTFDVCTSDGADHEFISQFIQTAFPSLDCLGYGWRYLDRWRGEYGPPVYGNEEECNRGTASLECWEKVHKSLGNIPGLEW